MIFTIIFAFILAKIKHYKINYLFKSWTIYPIILLELILLYFQINRFMGNVPFMDPQIFKKIYLASYLIPMFVYRQYTAGLIGSGSILIGTFLNKFVISQNNWKMPIYPSFSYWTGYMKAGEIAASSTYVLGDANTSWKILTDYIDFGYSILSVGDLFIHAFALIILYNTIKVLNINKLKEENAI